MLFLDIFHHTNMNLNILGTKVKYIYVKIVTLTIVLLDFIFELYLNKDGNHGNNINNVSHAHAYLEDNKVLSIYLSNPIECLNNHLFQIKLHYTKAYLSQQTCCTIKFLNINWNFRRKRGRHISEMKPRKWSFDYVYGVNKSVLRKFGKSATLMWNIRNIVATLVNIQALKPKIDTLCHHLVTLKIEICLITETWLKHVDLDSININVKNHGYIVISKEMTDRPSSENTCVFKKHLNISKIPM